MPPILARSRYGMIHFEVTFTFHEGCPRSQHGSPAGSPLTGGKRPRGRADAVPSRCASDGDRAGATERGRHLENLHLDAVHVRVSPAWTEAGQDALAWTKEQHLEGVTMKRLDSPYLPGARSRDWAKQSTSASRP